MFSDEIPCHYEIATVQQYTHLQLQYSGVTFVL